MLTGMSHGKKQGMKRIARYLVLLVAIGAAGFWAVTSPTVWRLVHPSRDLPDAGLPDLANGRLLFHAGDCAICHATPGQGNGDALGGGQSLTTAFGKFYMPNISPDPVHGIGRWTTDDFIRAMREGVTPDGRNEYPAFPYTSYQRMTANDLRDLFAYLKTLPPVQTTPPPHDLKFPFTLRRGVGVWRLAFLDGKPLPPAPNENAQWLRGRYLVEAVAHCAECHSPRNFMGAIEAGKRFAGGLDPSGAAYIPNITPDETGIGYWSEREIVTYLKTGLNPLGGHAGGDMAEIVSDTSRLPEKDLEAMAHYLKTISAVDAPAPGVPEPNRTDVVKMLPAVDRTKGGSALAALGTASGSQLNTGATLHVVTTTTFTFDEHAVAGGQTAPGKLLASAALTVLSHDGNRLQVRVNGWQPEGTTSILYALPGQRITIAVLAPSAVPKLVRGKPVRVAGTGVNWYPVNFTAWIDDTRLSADLNQLWRGARAMYASTCATCHALPAENEFLANQWIGSLAAMKPYASLDPDQYRLLLAYLQYHARDVSAQTLSAQR